MPSQIDMNTFDSLKQMADSGFIGQLVDTFLEDTPRQIRDMKAALKTSDPESFRRAAHSIKSTAATFGAVALSDLARELETLGKENRLEEAVSGLEAVDVAFQAAAQELRDLTE
jgi:HPt (histidine-containing phosphotransfer) domain-containing protein